MLLSELGKQTDFRGARTCSRFALLQLYKAGTIWTTTRGLPRPGVPGPPPKTCLRIPHGGREEVLNVCQFRAIFLFHAVDLHARAGVESGCGAAAGRPAGR